MLSWPSMFLVSTFLVTNTGARAVLTDIGSYVLYTHMMKQRRKVMKKLKEGAAKKDQ